MKMIRRILPVFLFSVMSILLLSCGYSEVRKKNLTRPQFSDQTTWVLVKHPVDFITYYSLYKDYQSTLIDPELLKQNLLIEIWKTDMFNHSEFSITDKINQLKYKLKESGDKQDYRKDQTRYQLFHDKKMILTIDSNEDDLLQFDITYLDKKYRLNGTVKQVGNIIHSFECDLYDGSGNKLCTFFREYRYFTNEYEILINNEMMKQNDPLLISSLCTVMDTRLAENGYLFRN